MRSLVRGVEMNIILTMYEIKGILESCMNDDMGKFLKFKRLKGSQRRHLKQDIRDYLEMRGMTIIEYNKWTDELNILDSQTAIELKDELLSYDDPEMVFKRLKELSNEFDLVLREKFGKNYNEFMGQKRHLILAHANHFKLILGLEKGARKMGYKDLAALEDFRNSGW